MLDSDRYKNPGADDAAAAVFVDEKSPTFTAVRAMFGLVFDRSCRLSHCDAPIRSAIARCMRAMSGLAMRKR